MSGRLEVRASMEKFPITEKITYCFHTLRCDICIQLLLVAANIVPNYILWSRCSRGTPACEKSRRLLYLCDTLFNSVWSKQIQMAQKSCKRLHTEDLHKIVR